MNLRIFYGMIITGVIVFVPVKGQNKDKAMFTVIKPGFFQNSILRDDQEVKEQISPLKENKIFVVDLSGYQLPNKIGRAHV